MSGHHCMVNFLCINIVGRPPLLVSASLQNTMPQSSIVNCIHSKEWLWAVTCPLLTALSARAASRTFFGMQ